MMDDVIEQVRGVLIATPERWNDLVASLPSELLTRVPAQGEWTALGCLQHLIDTERNVFPTRVKAFLAGQNFPAFNPDREGTKPGAASAVNMAAEFAHLRAESLALLTKVKPEDLRRTARHAEYGPVTMEQMLLEWAAHDLNHTVQAERAVMQPFIQGTGPWRKLFTDHDVERSQAQARASG